MELVIVCLVILAIGVEGLIEKEIKDRKVEKKREELKRRRRELEERKKKLHIAET
jgi:hypothetical protein